MAQSSSQFDGRTKTRSELRTTTMVIFILLGSTAFSLVFRGLRGDSFIFDVLTNPPGGTTGFLVVSMLTVFLLDRATGRIDRIITVSVAP